MCIRDSKCVDLIDGHFDDSFRTAAGEHRVGVSIGTASTGAGMSVEEVMSAADASMYEMKRRGQGHLRVSPKAIKYVEEALALDRVVPYLQPLVSVDKDGGLHLCGAEALVRVENEDGSIDQPMSILPGLGASKQALALDLRVLELAAAAAADWHRQRLVPANFYIAANLGAAAMADSRLTDKVISALAVGGLSPHNLVIEIPETAGEVDITKIDRLRNLGIRIAIDDVGCQFSNLERLVDIPAEIAKIDRRWLPDGHSDDTTKLELFTGLVQQCDMLDLQVCAEGIETEHQLKIVLEIGVERLQGFLFGRPVGLAHFEQLWSRPNGQSLRADATELSTTSRQSVR